MRSSTIFFSAAALLLVAQAQADVFSQIAGAASNFATAFSNAESPSILTLQGDISTLGSDALDGLTSIDIQSALAPVFQEYNIDTSSASSVLQSIENLPGPEVSDMLADVLDIPVEIADTVVYDGTTASSRKLLRA